ncbi:MAG TPA: FHA domain-containing protein, partial [Pseudomonadota bacterium]|nr:FHA domain-containing protein [Pseudomonadota bacterium]
PAPVGAAPASPESGKPGAVRLGGTALRGRLIVMRRDGSDGEAITLSGELFDIGRTAANKNFTDDPFLAARHVRFVMHGGGVRVRPVDLVNGVFIQLREPYELQAGDVFYIGRELIRYEPLPPEERDPSPAIEHGVRVFGSTPRESWARLRQLTTSALVRDVWHLSRAEVLLGREEGDIVFPDDEFMSRRHALITRVGGRVRLEDQHSSNGTYVRLRGERDVQPNDVLRVGDQVLRYEP